MKNYFLLCCFVPMVLAAQNKIKGVYKSPQDYDNTSLSYVVGCRSKDRIQRNDFLIRPYITVKQEGKRIRLNKKEIFGYRACDGKVYRFLNKKAVGIIESK